MITKEQAEYLVSELIDAVVDEHYSRGEMTNGSNQIALKGAKDAVIAALRSPVEWATGFAEWWKTEEPDHLDDITKNPQYTIRDLMLLSRAAWVAARSLPDGGAK